MCDTRQETAALTDRAHTVVSATRATPQASAKEDEVLKAAEEGDVAAVKRLLGEDKALVNCKARVRTHNSGGGAGRGAHWRPHPAARRPIPLCGARQGRAAALCVFGFASRQCESCL